MMPEYTRVLLVFALVLGCTTSEDAEGSDGDDAGPADGSDGDTAGTVSPRAGVWSYVDGGVQENTCKAELVGDPNLMFVLENDGGTTFTIQQSDPYDDFECTKSGTEFTCPDRLQGEVPIAMTDIVLEYGVSITGELDGAEEMSARNARTSSVPARSAKPRTRSATRSPASTRWRSPRAGRRVRDSP